MITKSIPKNRGNLVAQKVNVPQKSELRIYHNFSDFVYLRLLEGTAEIYGAQMSLLPVLLPFNKKSMCVFSYTGCLMEIYMPNNAQDVSYYVVPDQDKFGQKVVSINGLLEVKRCLAEQNYQNGPKVIILGQQNKGVSSLARTLVNYAVKREWRPILIDLEPGLNDTSIQGSLSAVCLEEYLSYDFKKLNKLSLFYGSQGIQERQELYQKVALTLIDTVKKQIEEKRKIYKQKLNSKNILEDSVFQKRPIFSSGIFYIMPQQFDLLALQVMKNLLNKIDPDLIVCLENDNLFMKLNKIRSRKCQIYRFRNNTGISTMFQQERKRLFRLQIQNFFFGSNLICVRDKLRIDTIDIYQIESMNQLPLNYLQRDNPNTLRINKIDPQINDLKGKVMVILNYPKTKEVTLDLLMSSEILNIVFVFDTDREKNMTIIRPNKIIENFQNYIFRVGDIKININNQQYLLSYFIL